MAKKYTVCLPYVAQKYYEVEAENEEEAIDKVFDENDIEYSITLCWSCAEKIDSDFILDDAHIYAETELG